MFPAKSLLALLALAVSFAGTVANPVPAPAHAALPFTRRLNLITFADIVKADQARAQAMKASSGAHKRAEGSVLVTNTVVRAFFFHRRCHTQLRLVSADRPQIVRHFANGSWAISDLTVLEHRQTHRRHGLQQHVDWC
ncbi:hypothetical protein HWV62_9233 [Athelia sp. TMB]|nr:hypothetical protein HWV62_9233 [Athelia sp. TMB]